MGKSKKRKRGPSSHEAIAAELAELVDRARAAAYRVVCAADDDEAVHDFRVTLRRMRTILRASRRTYGKKRVKPLEKALAGFGDATNPLRDAEVLEETLHLCPFEAADGPAVERWLSQRREREERLRDGVVGELLGASLEASFADLVALLGDGPRHDEPLRRFARSRLSEVRAEVAELLPVADDDIEALHRLRIRFKRLRYVGEMLRGLLHVLPRDERRDLGKKLKRTVKSASVMQKLLGQLHDADAALIALPDEPLDEADREVLRRGLEASRTRLAAQSLATLEQLPPSVVGTKELVKHVPHPPPALAVAPPESTPEM